MSLSEKHTTWIRSSVILLILVGIGAWGWKNFGASATSEPQTNQANQSAITSAINESDHVIVVTYFTSDQRCITCKKIEKLTHEAVKDGFKGQLAAKEIIFQTINFDRPENKHYVDDYQLAFKTVVVSERKKGKEVQWTKFDKVWELTDTPEQFKSYLQEGIQKYINSSKSGSQTLSKDA